MNRRILQTLLTVAAAAALVSGAGWRGGAAAPPSVGQAKPLVAIERYGWGEDPPQVVSDGADSVELRVAVSASPRLGDGAKVVVKLSCETEGAQMEYFPWDGVGEAELQPGGAVDVTFQVRTSLYNTHTGPVRFRLKLVDVLRREGGDYKSILEEVHVLEESAEGVVTGGKAKTLVVKPKK